MAATLSIEDRREALAGTVSARAIVRGGFDWLVPALVPTRAARERLARWARAGRPEPDRGALTIAGGHIESGLRNIVIGVVAQLPPPVAYHVVRNAIVVVVGRYSHGWVTHLPRVPAADEAPGLVVVSDRGDDEEVAALTAHEMCHHWLSHEVRTEPANAAAVEARYQPLADAITREWGDDPAVVFARALDEFRVATLANSWGFRGRAVDVERFTLDLRRARSLLERTKR